MEQDGDGPYQPKKVNIKYDDEEDEEEETEDENMNNKNKNRNRNNKRIQKRESNNTTDKILDDKNKQSDDVQTIKRRGRRKKSLSRSQQIRIRQQKINAMTFKNIPKKLKKSFNRIS